MAALRFCVAVTVCMCLAAALPSVSLAQSAKKEDRATARLPQPADIDRNGVIILVRGALLALDQANKTGNYTVLRDLGAPGFQVNTAARLAEIFAEHRKQNYDLAGIAVLDPQLTLLPQIERDGKMRMAGFFPSVPLQVRFELLFAPVDREWRLYGISVNFEPSRPAAPNSPVKEPSSEEPPPPAIAPSAEIGSRSVSP